MPTPTRVPTLWQAVEERLGAPVPPAVRRFCQLQGWLDDYLLGDPGEWEEAVGFLAQTAQNLKDSGVSESPSDSPTLSLASDGRWKLLQDLDVSFNEARPDRPRDSGKRYPISVCGPVLDLDTYPPAMDINIRFDHRLSRRALVNALRRLWPELRRRGWLRRTRRLANRALALIRFVCLETPPRMTWRARLRAWNTTNPHWAYQDPRAFERDFRRAEQELTGERYGLQGSYEQLSRLSLPQLIRAAAAGDRRARAIIKRSGAKWRKIAEGLKTAEEWRSEKGEGGARPASYR